LRQTDRSVSWLILTFSLPSVKPEISAGWQSGFSPYILGPRMTRDATIDSRQEILRTAARLFQQQGYDATSMNDVAAALKLSKGGLYHHFQSKDEILFDLMDHAMEITQERVITPVRAIADPEDALRTLIRLHIEVVLSLRDREITVMLHENHPLPPNLRRRINSRKKDYIHFVESLVAEAQKKRQSRGTVTPRAAAFALLGMINWIYQWYQPEGALRGEDLARQYTEIFFAGALQ
jgi:AcrR family transcriptional regulator